MNNKDEITTDSFYYTEHSFTTQNAIGTPYPDTAHSFRTQNNTRSDEDDAAVDVL